MEPLSIPLYAGGAPQSDRIFLQNLGASQSFVDQMRWEESGDTATTTWLERTLKQSGVGSDQDTPLLPAEEARARLKNERVTFDIPDTGIHEATYQAMLDRQYRKLAHADAIERGPSGFMAGARGFGIGLARQAIDPLNLASAFIPVVGEARMAEMMAVAGTNALARAGVYARVGAIEGAVGNVALEPAMHYFAGQLQEEYTMADSLLNTAFGSIIGGGLHVGVGTIRDWRMSKGATLPADAIPNLHEIQPQGEIPKLVQSMSYEDRQHLGAIALAQAIDGRDVDVAGVFDLYAAKRQELVAKERGAVWEAMQAADEAKQAIDIPAIREELAGTEIKPGFLKTAEELLADRQEARQRAQPGFLQSALDKLALRELDAERAGIAERIEGKVDAAVAAEREKIDRARAAEVALAKGETRDALVASQREETRLREEMQRHDLARDRETATRIADLMDRKPQLLAQELAELIDHYQLRADLLQAPDRLATEAAARDLTPNELQQKLTRMQARAERDLAVYREAGFPIGTLRQIQEANQRASNKVMDAAKRGQDPALRETVQDRNVRQEVDQILEEAKTTDGPERERAQQALQEELASLERAYAQTGREMPSFEAEDAGIKQAADEAKILKALGECRLRNR